MLDEKVQELDEVKQVWRCLDVAVHDEVHEGQHLDVVVHESHGMRMRYPL